MAVLIEGIVNKKYKFEPFISGAQKSQMFEFDCAHISCIILDESRESILDILFTSRLYNYLNVPTFRTFIGKDSENNLVILMENVLVNTINIQGKKPVEMDLFYSLYINEDLFNNLIKRNVFLSLVGDTDGNLGNIFINKKNIVLIDLQPIKDYTQSNFIIPGISTPIYLSNVFIEKDEVLADVIKKEFETIIEAGLKINNVEDKNFYEFFPIFDTQIVREKLDVDPSQFSDMDVAKTIELFSAFAAEENVNSTREEKKDVILKYSTIDFLERYPDKNVKIEDVRNYVFRGDWLNDLSYLIIQKIRSSIIETFRDILLLDNNDISFITLDYRPELLGITTEEISHYKSLIYEKQVEFFYYASKNNFIHKLFNLESSSETVLQEKFQVKETKYLSGDYITSKESIDNLNISKENKELFHIYYDGCIINNPACRKYFFDNKCDKNYDANRCESSVQILNCAEKEAIDRCTLAIRDMISNYSYKYELNEVKEIFRQKSKYFLQEFQKEFKSNTTPPWSKETYNIEIFGKNSNKVDHSIIISSSVVLSIFLILVVFIFVKRIKRTN